MGDGLPGVEGTFSTCTFWMVEVLSRAVQLVQGRFISGYMRRKSGQRVKPSEISPRPLTDLGLINAAFELDQALGNKP
jgi:hypothetical protein